MDGTFFRQNGCGLLDIWKNGIKSSLSPETKLWPDEIYLLYGIVLKIIHALVYIDTKSIYIGEKEIHEYKDKPYILYLLG